MKKKKKKKLMMLTAMLALVALAAFPALADTVVSQGFGQEAESGDAEISYEVSNSGDNSNVSVPALQFANTGNLQNAQGFVQYGSETDDIEISGSELVFAPSLESASEQSIEQAAAAYSW